MRLSITQALKRAKQVNRDGIATICGERRRTWSEVADRVPRAAAALQKFGLSRFGRVAVVSLNSDRNFELHYAVPWAGGAVAPVNTRLAGPEIEYIFTDCGIEIVAVDDFCLEIWSKLQPKVPSIKAVIHIGDGPTPEGMHSYEALIAANDPIADELLNGDDLAGIFYTSGSTGQAKGVMLSHDNFVSNAMNGIVMIGYDISTVFLHAAPMFHLADLLSVYAVALVAGTQVFIPRFDVEDCLATMAREKVTNVTLVPTMIAMLVNRPDVETYDLSSLKQFMFGAAPMPDGTLNRAVELWPDIKFLHGWGMTEVTTIGSMLPMEFREPKVGGPLLRSCGKAPNNAEIMIVDENDQELPRGTIGELVIRGPMVMLGYLNKPEETAKALRNGWMHSGDAAYMDEDGFVFIVDRLKDMIISGGENVYSAEVENAISVMAGVREVAVIGVPDEKWGERVHAVIVPLPGATLTETSVREHCRTLISGYKCPRSVEFRDEPLPVGSTGKISKTELRKPYWQGMSREVN
jgi:long-chain acyl-CoA synthetase